MLLAQIKKYRIFYITRYFYNKLWKALILECSCIFK